MSDLRFNRWLHNSGTGGVTQDSSGRVGIGSSVPRTTLDVVGIVSATEFSGNLVGNVSGATSIVVGDKFISSSGVGLGQTDTTGRNAGVGTATGSLVFNSDTSTVDVWTGSGWVAVGGGPSNFIQATGGTISDYQQGATFYRAHIFTSSGTLSVTAAPTTNNTVEYLVVAGGGAGATGSTPNATWNPIKNGTENLGGGGGSVGGGGGVARPGGSGGSGIVIIAYPS